MSSQRRSISQSSRSGPDLSPLTQALSEPSIRDGGYTYTDPGPAPDDRKTGRSIRRTGTTLSQEHEVHTRQSPSQRLQDLSLRIHKRNIDGGWRAQLVDSKDERGSAQEREDTISETEILRNWIREENIDDDFESFPVLNVFERGPPGSTIDTPESLGHIRWLHDHKHVMTKSAFEQLVLVHGCQPPGSGMHGLTKRLLKRVYSSDERWYVNGKFLLPTAIRYDGQSKMPNEQDQPSLFLNFPYLSLEHHHSSTCRQCGRKEPEAHPMRSLFQFRYRLQKTRVKDTAQVVTNLSPTLLSKCLPSGIKDTFLNRCGTEAPLIYVPQLWIAMINGASLRGNEIRIKKTTALRRAQHDAIPPLVRIIFDHSLTTEYFTYPSEQCSWWFALLNKQRIILNNYNQVHADARKDPNQGRTNANPRATKVNFAPSQPLTAQEYIFCLDETPQADNRITIYNWRNILLYAGNNGIERLDIWLRKRAPDVSITMAGGGTVGVVNSTTTSTQTSITQVDPASTSPAATGAGSAANSQTQHSRIQTATSSTPSPSASTSLPSSKDAQNSDSSSEEVPFFCWPIIDDFRRPSDLADVKRAAALLERVNRDFCSKHATLLSPHLDRQLLAVPSKDADITDYNYQAILQLLRSATSSTSPDHLRVLFEFLARCQSLLSSYVPVDPEDTSTPVSLATALTTPRAILLYWSLVRAVLDLASKNVATIPSVVTATGCIKEMQRLARELHLGTKLVSLDPERETNPFVPNRVMLESMMLSLTQTFELLAETLLLLRTPSKGGSAVADVASAAQSSLADAKAQLIVEADDMVPEKGPGSVVTPEAIVIMLLQRLSSGIYHEEKFEILEIYEEVVESIAIKLDSEKGASRRLLLKINSLVEELDIVLEVLRQQSAILKMFRQALDPAWFERRTIDRQINFENESKCIDSIIQGVKGRTIECEELKERAERLAEQNVRLVETQEDDNSKAIMVFTIVTVLFLPPSFISSYFGMNLEGISDTTSGPGHFWYIAAPLTIGVTLLCGLLVYFTTMRRRWKKWRHVKKEGSELSTN